MKRACKRRVFAVMTAVAVLLGGAVLPPVSGNAGNYTAYADEYQNLQVRSIGDTDVKQDGECEISFRLTNTHDTEFSFDGAKLVFSKSEGLSVSGGVGATVTFNKRNDETEVRFTVKASRFCDTGIRNFQLVVTKNGATQYTSQYFYLNVTENFKESVDGLPVNSVDIRYSILPETGFVTGGGNSMSFEVYNNGSSSLKDAQIKLTLPEGVSIDNGSNLQTLGTISVGNRAHADFPIRIEKEIESKNYVITAKVSGLNYKNEEVSVEREFYIPVHGDGKKKDDDKDDDENKGTPQLMVSEYTYGGSYVQAGTEFPLGLTLLNTSKETIYNVKVTISASDGNFVPVGSSNSFYIESVAAGASYDKALMLSAKNDAPQETVAVTVSMHYENEDHTAFDAEDTISVPVTQRTRLVVDDIVPPMECYVGNGGSASVDFYNMGKTTLSNVRVNATGNFDIMESNSYYAGNMESGKNDSYSFTFIPREVGPMTGVVTFSYEDAGGNAQYLEIPFTFEAMEMPVFEEDPGMYEEPTVESAIPWSLIIAAAVILVLIILFIIIRRILKKKKEKALELEDIAFETADDEADAENAEDAGAENADGSGADAESAGTADANEGTLHIGKE